MKLDRIPNRFNRSRPRPTTRPDFINDPRLPLRRWRPAKVTEDEAGDMVREKFISDCQSCWDEEFGS